MKNLLSILLLGLSLCAYSQKSSSSEDKTIDKVISSSNRDDAIYQTVQHIDITLEDGKIPNQNLADLLFEKQFINQIEKNALDTFLTSTSLPIDQEENKIDLIEKAIGQIADVQHPFYRMMSEKLMYHYHSVGSAKGNDKINEIFNEQFKRPNNDKYKGILLSFKAKLLERKGLVDSAIVVKEQAITSFKSNEQIVRKAIEIIGLNKIKNDLNRSGSSTELENAITVLDNNNLYVIKAEALISLSNLKRTEKKFVEALSYVDNALEIYKEHNNVKGIIFTKLERVRYLSESENLDEAFSTLYEARALAQQNNLQYELLSTYSSEGILKYTDRKAEEAFAAYGKVIELSKGRFQQQEAHAYFYIGTIADIIGTLNEKKHVLDKYSTIAFDAITKMNDLKMYPTDSYHYQAGQKVLATHYIKIGEYNLAETKLLEALEYSKKSKNAHMEYSTLFMLTWLERYRGDYEAALNYVNQGYSVKLRDQADQYTQLTETRIQIQNDKEKEIIALQTQKNEDALNAKQSRTAFLGIVAFLLALSALSMYLISRRKNREISNQKNELNEINNVKDTLFQIIGHDLKKPSINFRNVSKNINYLLDKKDYNRLQALGEEVDQDAKSLYNLTDNLLNWALMQKDAVRIQPQKVNLHEIVNYNLDLFQSLAKRKNITLDNNLDQNVTAHVDRNSIDTIVRNLLDNAIKYTPDSGSISIYSESKDGMIQIKVKDNGIGMTKSLMNEINASRTVQSSKGTDGEKGSGIGLQLVKQLINKNKGTLRIESMQGQGSVISIQLPVAG